jgi:hypothetical protein
MLSDLFVKPIIGLWIKIDYVYNWIFSCIKQNRFMIIEVVLDEFFKTCSCVKHDVVVHCIEFFWTFTNVNETNDMTFMITFSCLMTWQGFYC